jgi:hypothetical protein
VKTFLPAVFALGVLTAVNPAAFAAAASVEQRVAGPFGEKDKYVVSPQGGRLGTISPKGSRVVVIVDNVVGPPFDEIVQTSHGVIDPRPYWSAFRSTAPEAAQITFSRDGSRYAYIARLSQEWVVMVDNKELLRLPVAGAVGATAGIAGMAGNTELRLEFSGVSGKHLLFSRSVFDGIELWVDGKKWPGFHRSGGGGTEGTVDPLISPDGEHVAVVANLSREKRVLILDGKDVGYFGTHPQFTPDSRHLICVSETPKGQTVLIDGKPFLATRAVLGVHVPPVGNRIIVAITQMNREGNAAEGSVLVVDGKPVPTTLTSEMTIKKVVFSPDGKRYAAVCGRTGSEFVVIDGKKGREYSSVNTQIVGDTPNVIMFSPDSSKLVYTAHSNSSGGFVVIEEEESDAMDNPWFKFSPDGKRIAYGGSTNQNQRTILVVDGKKVPLQPGWLVTSFTFSPEGSHYAFLGQRGGDNGVFLDGKNTEVSGDFAFSPDGKHLGVSGVGGPEKKGGLFVDGQIVHETYDKPVRYRGFTSDSRHFIWEARERATDPNATPGAYDYVTYVDGVPAARFTDPASVRTGNAGMSALNPMRIGSPWKMPATWSMNAAGKLVFLTAHEDGVKRVEVAPPADTNVDTMMTEAKEAPIRAAAKAAEEKKMAAEAAAAKKAKADADAAEAAAKAKADYDARVAEATKARAEAQAKAKADYDARVAKQKADYEAAMAKRKADYEAAVAKQKAAQEAALAKLKQQQKK